MKPSGFQLPVLLLLCLLSLGLLACESRFQADFPFEGVKEETFFAASKRAAAGRLSLGRQETLQFLFEPPLEPGANRALEIRYRLEDPDAPCGIVLRCGDTAWELPRGDGEIHYTVPLKDAPLASLNAASVLETGPPASGGAKKDPQGIILKLALVPVRFGYGPGESTPFVHTDGEGALIIDPPAEYAGNLSFRAAGEGNITLEAGENCFEASLPVRIPQILLPPGKIKVISQKPPLEAELFLDPPQAFPRPIPADPGLVLTWPLSAWRDRRFELFRWEDFPTVLIFDTADYAVQDNLFKRLAFFTEKEGFRGRLAPDKEIASLHGWNAHDYRAADLAAFFEKARAEDFPLLPEELELRAILLQAGIINLEGEAVCPGEGAVVSISRESADYLRNLFMAHEGFHGIFFVDEDFRGFSLRRWEALKGKPKEFILSYFGYQHYDTTDSYLMVNEFMAHILQQPVSQARRYFGEVVAGRIASSSWRYTVLPPKDEATGTWPLLGEAFTREAEAFSAYVRRRWGLAAGRVSRVRVLPGKR